MITFTNSKDPKSILDDQRFLVKYESEKHVYSPRILGELIIGNPKHQGTFFRPSNDGENSLGLNEMEEIVAFAKANPWKPRSQ